LSQLFYRNLGDGTFKEDALASGVAFNADGLPQTNMGLLSGTMTMTGKSTS
jgi:hypothetical protein